MPDVKRVVPAVQNVGRNQGERNLLRELVVAVNRLSLAVNTLNNDDELDLIAFRGEDGVPGVEE